MKKYDLSKLPPTLREVAKEMQAEKEWHDYIDSLPDEEKEAELTRQGFVPAPREKSIEWLEKNWELNLSLKPSFIMGRYRAGWAEYNKRTGGCENLTKAGS